MAIRNPSPNSNFYDPDARMMNTPAELHRYMGRISAPLLAPIDIDIEVTLAPYGELTELGKGEFGMELRGNHVSLCSWGHTIPRFGSEGVVGFVMVFKSGSYHYN